jgi:hypothetical protein
MSLTSLVADCVFRSIGHGTVRDHMDETTNAIVSSPIAVSNTLWHQRAIMLSISNFLCVSGGAI